MDMKTDNENAVTGQCDHIVGWVLGAHPELGDRDRISRQSNRDQVDELFRFCPACGFSLDGKGEN